MPLLKLSHDRFLPTLEEALHEVTVNDWRGNPTAHADATALVICNDDNILDLVCDVSGFDIVILDFPAFTDGRAYSQARILRERLNYTGEIRARGNVLRDQIFFMVRCGFNAFEFDAGTSKEAEAALREFTFAYQPAADKFEPVWRKRVRRVAAA